MDEIRSALYTTKSIFIWSVLSKPCTFHTEMSNSPHIKTITATAIASIQWRPLPRNMSLNLGDHLPRQHHLPHEPSIGVSPRSHAKLLRIDEDDVERLVGAGKGADENAPVGGADPEELAEESA